jgi:hypothetical protein
MVGLHPFRKRATSNHPPTVEANTRIARAVLVVIAATSRAVWARVSRVHRNTTDYHLHPAVTAGSAGLTLPFSLSFQDRSDLGKRSKMESARLATTPSYNRNIFFLVGGRHRVLTLLTLACFPAGHHRVASPTPMLPRRNRSGMFARGPQGIRTEMEGETIMRLPGRTSASPRWRAQDRTQTASGSWKPA